MATSGTAETKKIVWDGQAYLLETDNSNVTQAVYTQAAGPFGDLVSQRRSGATSYYLFDALGSTDRLISAAQAVLNSYVYKAFGEIAASTGSTTNPFRFVGRYGYYYYGWSVGSDLYVRARWYKPVQARWLSVDPLGFAAGDWNLFRYVGNRVAFLTDPSGLLVIAPAGPAAGTAVCNPVGVVVVAGSGTGCVLYVCVTKPLLEPCLKSVFYWWNCDDYDYKADCNCFCVKVDSRGKTHGPYKQGTGKMNEKDCKKIPDTGKGKQESISYCYCK